MYSIHVPLEGHFIYSALLLCIVHVLLIIHVL